MLFLYFLFINLIKLVHVIIIDKCYYEGDFVVYCNKTRIVPNNQIELIHKAQVTYGIQYNDTLCTHTKLTCSKTYLRHDCIDNTYCEVTNGWLTLEPYCKGNSYYTQFEFECQPAYYMCDKEHHENVFSGLVLSPSYPLLYTIDSLKNCIQTFVFPTDHYVEILVENFTMPRSDNCARDFLEILEYKTNRDDNRNAHWSSLTSLCGKYEQNLKLIVKSNIISFKLRTLPLKIGPKVNHLINFKIFIQAVSPLAANLDNKSYRDLEENEDYNKTDAISNSLVNTLIAAFSGVVVIFVAVSIGIILITRTRKPNYNKSKKSNLTNLQKPTKLVLPKQESPHESICSSFTPSQSKFTPQISFTMSNKDTDMPRK
jgi:ribosome-associated toxin RatA of RatAB toxin-antitoxin module